MLNHYLETLKPMQRAKAKDALTMQVRYNGGHFLLRHEIVEARIRLGGKVTDRRGEIVLMSPEGTWLDARNITKHGLNYASWLSVQN